MDGDALKRHYAEVAALLLLLLRAPRVDLTAVAGLLAGLDAATAEWIGQELPTAYDGATGGEIDGDFMALATTLHTDLAEARQTVWGLVQRLAGRPAAERITQLAAAGIQGYVSAAGRAWQLETYADVAIDSTITHARNTGTMNRVRRRGGDLVRLVAQPDCCEICAPYADRIFSISGEDPDFPPLDFAFPGDWASLHAKCRCLLEDVSDDEADGERPTGNAPFDVDPRTDAQRRAYIAGQQAKARERATIDQWRRHRARLGRQTPSLARFRAIKAEGGEAYQTLQTAYRAAGKTEAGS